MGSRRTEFSEVTGELVPPTPSQQGGPHLDGQKERTDLRPPDIGPRTQEFLAKHSSLQPPAWGLPKRGQVLP